MPEGPEVAIMARQLSRFKGSKLKKINVKIPKYYEKLDKKLLKNYYPSKIIKIGRKGKFIYLNLENDKNLGFTLGMTGHFWIPSISKNYITTEGHRYNKKYDYIEFETNKGNFYFNDPRKFGHFYLIEDIDKKLNTLGVDVLDELPKMSSNKFIDLIRKHPKKVLADLLLDQKIISGIGNIYRSEAMYRAKINPLREIRDLSDSDLKRLKNALEYVTKISYDNQKKGLHEHIIKIYGNVNANKIRRRGRTIWYDKEIQN